MSDIKELQNKIADWVSARGWDGFQTPKNLAMSIAIEAAEIMEEFQWKDQETPEWIMADPVRATHIKEEIADVANYLFHLATVLEIDLKEAIEEKLEKNSQRKPVEKCIPWSGGA